ncbi:MAG: O-antigen ligase family protein [Terriglobia bacterium]
MVHEQYSYLTRLEAGRVLWQIIERSPIIGSGPANYYHYTPLFPILGWYVHFNSHNNYADLLAQTGGLGLLAFLWFAYEMFRMAFRIRLKMPEGFARAYVTGALGGLAATLVSGSLAIGLFPSITTLESPDFVPAYSAG